MDIDSPTFSVHLVFQGKTETLSNLSVETTGEQIHTETRRLYGLADETSLKILVKGKQIPNIPETIPALIKAPSSKKPLKFLIMATSQVVLDHLATQRSDPTIRGFDQELHQNRPKNRKELLEIKQSYWGGLPQFAQQHSQYKFCKLQACTWQSFGHRPTDSTPHAFAAQDLLERLATDPGIQAVLKSRELVVGTLGEMDPIDDRIMKAKQAEQDGSNLLGYNTNAGARIDIKLRTDDLSGFRPYDELVATLLHELSHNWVGDHNLLFWTNYGQMRAEYLAQHKGLQSLKVNGGQTLADLAKIPPVWLKDIATTVLQELVREMAPHGLHPSMLEHAIRQHCQSLEAQYLSGHAILDTLQGAGDRLGGDAAGAVDNRSARERALAAAERRRQQEQQNDSSKKPPSSS